MSIPETLREIHRLRRHARDLQAELDRGPFQVKAHRAKYAKTEGAFKTAQDALKKLKVATHENEVTLKATHAQIAKYEGQRDGVTDPKQIEAFRTQIKTARTKAQELEDAILEAITETEERTPKLPLEERAVAKAKEELAAFDGSHAEKIARITGDLKAALAELKVVEKQLPIDVVPQYKRLVNAYGADCLAPVQGQNCSHCHTQITQQNLHEVEGDSFVCCRSCGRGLYMPA